MTVRVEVVSAVGQSGWAAVSYQEKQPLGGRLTSSNTSERAGRRFAGSASPRRASSAERATLSAAGSSMPAGG